MTSLVKLSQYEKRAIILLLGEKLKSCPNCTKTFYTTLRTKLKHSLKAYNENYPPTEPGETDDE